MRRSGSGVGRSGSTMLVGCGAAGAEWVTPGIWTSCSSRSGGGSSICDGPSTRTATAGRVFKVAGGVCSVVTKARDGERAALFQQHVPPVPICQRRPVQDDTPVTGPTGWVQEKRGAALCAMPLVAATWPLSIQATDTFQIDPSWMDLIRTREQGAEDATHCTTGRATGCRSASTTRRLSSGACPVSSPGSPALYFVRRAGQC